MKQILLILSLFLSLKVNAQGFSTLKGVVFHATEHAEDGGRTTVNMNYFFSFTDKMLLHQVLTKGNEYSDGQFYLLKNFSKNYSKGDEKTVYKVDALSGVSGTTYSYVITIYDDGTGNITCDGTKYYGDFYQLKTYEQ